MRIGIITFWDSQDNYGQLLQCYALQAYLKRQGHEPFVIRYRPKIKQEINISKLSPRYIYKYLKHKLISKVRIDSGIKHNFNGFREHITYSTKLYTGFNDLMIEDWAETDAFICGSDQIWSPRSIDELRSYFLSFAPFQKLRIAYAPSFGRTELDSEYQEKLHGLLAGFDAISVREDSGIDILTSVGYVGKIVCDPTLLLDQKQYLEEFNINGDTKNNNLFLYFINWETDWVEDDVIKLSKDKNLSPKLFSTKGFKTSIPDNTIQSPEEWLRTISTAKFSIVNSFHGLVFSIIFHIPFAVYLLKGKQATMNGRINSLLSLLNLSDRIVSGDNNLEKIYNRDIDWKDVDNKLSFLQNDSKTFLVESFINKNIPKKKYNICFLTSGAVHHKYGGLDRVTEMLADRFRNDGHDVYYLSMVRRDEYDKSRQYFFPDSTEQYSHENQHYLTRFIAEHSINILINQEGNVGMCIPFQRPEDLTVITCLHFNPNYIDDNHFKHRFRNDSLVKRSLGKLIYYIKPINSLAIHYLRRKLHVNYCRNLVWCDKYILLSSKFKKPLLALLKEDKNVHKIEAIHNPCVILDNQETYNKSKRIIYVGRLDNNFKRIDWLIKTIGKLFKENPEWKFTICGDGPDRQYLTQLAHSISTQIEILGYCDPTEYYKDASIIVMSSNRCEGWGMVLVEAMNYGVVPVATKTYESLEDIIDDGKCGYIIDKGSEDFSLKLHELMNNTQLLKTFSQNAQNKVKEFDINNISYQWYKLFDKCCSR